MERHVALLYVLFLLGMGAVATLLAHRTRVLVTSSARGALEADRAQRNLALILREHHDLRSQLATATINADLAGRELAAMPGRSLQPLIERVRLSLTQINSAVRAIKEQSYESLVELDAPRPVDLKEPIDAVRQELARRFPAVLLDVRLGSDVPAPWVAGGSDGMRRLLLNLAVNACEGSGEKAATLIVIEGASTPGGDTVIVVRDDGPGFTGPVLAAPGVRASSKADGFGIGLSLVRKITELSGGRVNWANDPHGGARVELVLPARPSSRRGALRLSMPED